MIKNDLVLRAARRERTERTPVWLMRQAGRFDPEYLALRARANLPLEALFRDPALAAEISLLPKRFGVDAIILFQDILTPLAPMGASFVFRPGPILETPVRSAADVDALCPYDPPAQLGFIAESIELVQTALDGELPLLGFAGAPLTLAFFLIEGQSPGDDPTRARAIMRDSPALFHRLLERLCDMTVDYLAMQIDAGVDGVQLFESCADLLSPEEYRQFAHRYHVEVFSRLASRVPTILFAKEHPDVELMASCGASVLSVGTCVDLSHARRLVGDHVALQGNVDNRLLACGSLDEIERAVRTCVHAGGGTGHILNLNHGLLRDTPVESVRRLIDTCKATAVHPEPEEATTG